MKIPGNWMSMSLEYKVCAEVCERVVEGVSYLVWQSFLTGIDFDFVCTSEKNSTLRGVIFFNYLCVLDSIENYDIE